MRSSLRLAFPVLLAILSLVTLVPASAEAPGILDGRSFSVLVGEQGHDSGDPDTLIFVAGGFRSTGCDAYGFQPTAYTAEERDGAIHWRAEATSETEGTISWTGVVTGSDVAGDFVWAKAGQDPIEYWFEGTESTPAPEAVTR